MLKKDVTFRFQGGGRVYDLDYTNPPKALDNPNAPVSFVGGLSIDPETKQRYFFSDRD
jgi:hypothetical protein